jgi:two-component system, OmpR family, sensor histidine kinase KdpD
MAALPPPVATRAPRSWTGYAWTAAMTVALTVVASPLSTLLAPANIVMLYLLATVAVALRWGRGPAAFAAVLNVVAFDFFFVPPRFSLAIGDAQYLITFAVMLLVGLTTGQLTGGLRQQARISALREKRAHSLFALTRELSGALAASQVAERGAAAVREQYGGEVLVLVREDARLPLPAQAPAGFEPQRAMSLLADPPPPATHGAGGWEYLALAAPARVRGVLALRPGQPGVLQQPEERQHLETMARQIAIGLERVHYVQVAQQTELEIESERLRNALLAAISHDVRTPLTALIGLAESLRTPQLPPAQAETAADIAQQARSLARLVDKLLEMARLQSGRVNLRLQWESLEEVVGSALRGAAPQLAGRAVRVHLPADLPLVEFDAVLLERVLANLLENAVKYGAPPFEITARADADALVVSVRDHGAGLPAAVRGQEALLFEKFTRGCAESSTPGVGLGLAICKAVIDAHGGSLQARNAAAGGAEFTFRLPRRPPPAAPA